MRRQLEAVCKRIVNVATANPGSIIHYGAIHTRAAQMRNAGRVITATESRMRLLCRTKVVFDAR
jgi:hypothetical protein